MGGARAEMAARGFRMLKFDVDVPTPYETDEYNRDLSHPEIEHMAALVAAARQAVGNEIGLAIDCHWNYSVQSAIDLARAVEKYKLLWLEDPVPPENMRAIGAGAAQHAGARRDGRESLLPRRFRAPDRARRGCGCWRPTCRRSGSGRDASWRTWPICTTST